MPGPRPGGIDQKLLRKRFNAQLSPVQSDLSTAQVDIVSLELAVTTQGSTTSDLEDQVADHETRITALETP